MPCLHVVAKPKTVPIPTTAKTLPRQRLYKMETLNERATSR